MSEISNFFEGLDLIGPHDLLQGEEIKIQCMREVKSEFACLSQRFREVIVFEIVMKDQVISNLRDLLRVFLRRIEDQCGSGWWIG